MSQKKLPKPQDFGLASFAKLISNRAPIPGEMPGSYAAFHTAMMKDLGPVTPYEIVRAENLIGIEWELLQHRRMRDQAVRSMILRTIRDAVVKKDRARYLREITAAQEEWCAAGKEGKEFKADPFDSEAAGLAGDDLAQRSVDSDPNVQSAAHAEVAALGLKVLDLMVEAHRDADGSVLYHEGKIQEAERRRRGVKADLDALQKVRPIETEHGEVVEAEVVEG